MTYRDLLYKATRLCDKGEITLGEYEEMTKPLDREIEQEPRKGHWISRPHIYGVAFCSECGFELKINNTNYCPNCGAKMESEINNGNNDK